MCFLQLSEPKVRSGARVDLESVQVLMHPKKSHSRAVIQLSSANTTKAPG